MAWITANEDSIPWKDVNGTELQASTTITSSTAGTAVELGKGLFIIAIDVTAVHQESGFDNVCFWIESNTKAAASTYTQIGCLAVGDATGVGIAIGTNGVGTFPVLVSNPNDNGIRINAKMLGSTDSVTYSAKAYPIRDQLVV